MYSHLTMYIVNCIVTSTWLLMGPWTIKKIEIFLPHTFEEDFFCPTPSKGFRKKQDGGDLSSEKSKTANNNNQFISS